VATAKPSAIHVAALFVHPVKSCAAIAVDAADADERGFANDRRFMIVGSSGDFVTQRDDPRLASIVPTLDAGDDLLGAAGTRPSTLTLTAPRLAPDLAPLCLPLNPTSGEVTRVRVWSSVVDAVDAGSAASCWLAGALGRTDLRLVWMPDEARRPVDEDEPDGPRVSFADAYPHLVVSEASLEAVEARAPGTGVARRFRPNVVLAGLGPFEEDEIAGVTIAGVRFDFLKACSRCTVVDIDPDTTTSGKEPLASLATFRRRNGKVMFGQNAVSTGIGRIAVGDVATPHPPR